MMLMRAVCIIALWGFAIGRLQKLHAAETVGLKGLPCKAPVARAPVKFPEGMVIGGKADFDMYSGYVNVTDQDYLFYWFFEAQAGAPIDAPVIVWSNGGPGCSAMEGATTELGPYVLFGSKANGFGGKLSKNPYAWNRRAHVLVVDQPRYVGFSCGTGDYVTSSKDAGLDMVTFLLGWRQLFPEHTWRNLVIAAESYGGRYLPAWTKAIMDHNDHASQQERLPLTGIAIGNGLINGTLQGDAAFVDFAKETGIVPRSSQITTENQARSLMTKKLGYEPNFYDYRLEAIDCCGCAAYNYTAWSYWFLNQEVTKALNVCGNAGDKAFAGCAAGCVDLPNFDEGDTFQYSAALERALSYGIKVTLYYGEQDTACNHVGGFSVAKHLDFRGAADFAAANLKDLSFGGAPAGKVKQGGGLTWMQIEAAGHMVPLDQGPAGYHAIETVLSTANSNVV